MGFKIETVSDCPVTRGSRGVLTMTADQIAMVAGAVRDNIEWMLLLHGERSADGYSVRVDRFTVPKQHRDGAEVEMAEEVVLADDVVGVMHSHHRMGAFFSRTDVTELNPRFPSSIVVAIADNNLGFAYKATGRVVLPCKAMGEVDFELAVEGVERFAAEPIRGEHDQVDAKSGFGLRGCTHRQYVIHPENNFLAVDQTACGLTIGEVIERPMVFGMDGTALLEAIKAETVEKVDRRLPAHYQDSTQLTKAERKALKKQEKLSARRNGLVKLETPTAQTGGFSSTNGTRGKCDECGEVRWLTKVDRWYVCLQCEMADMDDSSESMTTIRINDDEPIAGDGGYGYWGV